MTNEIVGPYTKPGEDEIIVKDFNGRFRRLKADNFMPLSGFLDDYRAGNEHPKQAIPGEDLQHYALGHEFAIPDAEIFHMMSQVTGGDKREKREAEKVLIRTATSGGINDLLDVKNAALITWQFLRNPRLLNISQVSALRPQFKTPEALRNCRDFIKKLTATLSQSAYSYLFNPKRNSTVEKLGLACYVLKVLDNTFSRQDLDSLPIGFQSYREQVLNLWQWLNGPNKDLTVSLTISLEISQSEIEKLNIASQVKKEELTQNDFDLMVKGCLSWHRRAKTAANKILHSFLSDTTAASMINTLHFFNGSLQSADQAVRNCATTLLTRDSDSTYDTEHLKLHWVHQLQKYIREILLHEDVATNIVQELEMMIVLLDRQRRLTDFAQFLSVDYDYIFSQSELLRRVPVSKELRQCFISSETDNYAFGLLIRALRELEQNQIEQEVFLELFDPRRRLGFFLEHLQKEWSGLQRITREVIWPSFIAGRGAKLWPSERELDILEFTGHHPASVLGFSGIRFFTHGYTAPEVGLEFTFKDNDKVLHGSLDKNGQLCDLPFELENSHSDIYSFLEHLAVTSFQEMVTVADKRIKLKEGKVKPKEEKPPETTEQSPVLKIYARSLPRRETTYLTFERGRQPKTVTSDEVIEQARQRERLPRLISQRVVPLPYAQRYRYYRDLVAQARERGLSGDEVKQWQGLVLENLAMMPKPSSRKLDNLPPEFELEQTPDGKYLDTWRREHVRPKPKKGEEQDLPTIFEKRFRAAPIALTTHLSTWFTQPLPPTS